MSICSNLESIRAELKINNAQLVAVSKTRSIEEIQTAYQCGHRIFGENRVQELLQKVDKLPQDIEWHLIGHLQTNKVKYIASFISMIHAVDSFHLMKEINKQALKCSRKIKVLLQLHIAREESKFGFDRDCLMDCLDRHEAEPMENIEICGLMGMASFVEDVNQVSGEFASLNQLFKEVKEKYFNSNPAFKELSMGMSGDYQIALQQGSTLVRIGTAVFEGH